MPLLTTVDDSVWIYANVISGSDRDSLLKSILLPSLTTVGDTFYADCNYKVTTLNLSSLKRIEKDFYCSAQQSLISIDLPLLEYVGGIFDSYMCSSLQAINVPKIKSINKLQLLNAPILPCSQACQFKSVIKGSTIHVSGLKESSCEYKNEGATQTFTEFCAAF